MPRKARKISESGIYHIMLRGINKQQIFNDEEDFDKFLWILKETKTVSGYKLYAYCLMSNHIHLLIRVEKEPVEQIIKRIAGRFVYWYNTKYQRSGHLFQDRFRSEPVETDEYFLTVLRYIHQNPIKAGICYNIDKYKYSSYNDYINNKFFVDTDFVEEMLDFDTFAEFHLEIKDDRCLDIDEKERVRRTDEQVNMLMFECCGCRNPIEFQSLSDSKKEDCVREIYIKGASIRQISRLTGISKGLVEKWLK